MRVLVLTNHFAEFAGSEVVALEVARWFAGCGDDVVLAANLVRAPMSSEAADLTLTTDFEGLALETFDLIWCQHDLLTLAPWSAFENAARSGSFPHTVLASLSPFEPYEHVDGVLANALLADVYANSEETAAEIKRRNPRLRRVRVFHNAAPPEFWNPDQSPAQDVLRSVLSISNHPPAELTAALAILRSRGIATREMGLHQDYARVRPEDLGAADAVVSIGKTAVYALSRSRPLYMYDGFGGDGWLGRDNFQHSAFHNFSGRPRCRRLSAEEIASELVEGYPSARREAEALRDGALEEQYSLERHLSELRARAGAHTDPWRARVLSAALDIPSFREHFEVSRHKNLVMKRAYLIANPANA